MKEINKIGKNLITSGKIRKKNRKIGKIGNFVLEKKIGKSEKIRKKTQKIAKSGKRKKSEKN